MGRELSIETTFRLDGTSSSGGQGRWEGRGLGGGGGKGGEWEENRPCQFDRYLNEDEGARDGDTRHCPACPNNQHWSLFSPKPRITEEGKGTRHESEGR
jgi:hypothetical protein